MLTVGQTLDRYVVEDYLGHGGMAVVYRVHHAELDTLHALKVLTVARPKVRERLLQEGRAQATLRHPNLVGVTDVLRIDGSLALVMEYVDGPDLGKWLARYRRASVDECRALLKGICDGVGEAHEHGVAHRDLKPANVLLERRAGGFRPKVTDFGIAKLIEEGQTGGTTRSNVAMGTPHYMAPEQIRDAATVDARADVFAIGAILYELATGIEAFPGDDVLTVLNAVAVARFTPPVEHRPDLPADLARAIAGCLVVDPDARFQTCAEVLGALDEEIPASARVQRGMDLSAKDWEDAETRKARQEWLKTGTPTVMRRASIDDEDTTEALPPGSLPPHSLTPDEPAAPVSGQAPTVPRAVERTSSPPKSLPPDSLPSDPPSNAASLPPSVPKAPPTPAAVLVVRRVVVAAMIGIVLGMFGFLAIVRFTGFPGPAVAPDREAQVGLEQVVDPEAPPP